MRSALRNSSTQVRWTASSTSASLRRTARADPRSRPSNRRTVSAHTPSSPQESATSAVRSDVAGASVLQVRVIGGSFGDPLGDAAKPPIGRGVATSVGRRIRGHQNDVREVRRRAEERGGSATAGLVPGSAPEPPPAREALMSNHVYRLSEVVGSSPTSIDDAIKTAISKAAETVRNIEWFQTEE